MLLGIHVQNLALIHEVEVDFGKNLNILTGETGAGKSIIIGSVNLALGGKASKDLIRQGADSALVELYFKTDDKKVIKKLEDMDIPADDGNITITRRLMPNRSVCRVNGEIVSARVLSEVSANLIDIHGQHDHQSLLHISKHLDILDDYSKVSFGTLKQDMADAYELYMDLTKTLENANLDTESRRREQSFISYEISEIDEAKLIEGEDEELSVQYKKMSNAKKITDCALETYQMTENSASDAVSRGLRALYPAAEYDTQLSGLLEQLQDIENLLNDFNRELSGYMEGLVFDDETFAAVEQRLDLINDLKAKYGATIPDILDYKAKKEAELEKLENYDAYIQDLKKKLAGAKENYEALAAKVSDIRKNESRTLENLIEEALKELNFLDVRFEIQIRSANHPSKNGMDEVEFMISTNPGEPVKSLSKVASGGELSRIMLAIKSVLADADDVETLIFDEIDTGISGRTAQKVSERLAVIAANHQVLCISHLPQIASMADHHFLIEKNVENDRTATHIQVLDDEASSGEIARMLGGAQITGKVIENAREMKSLAAKTKKLLRCRQ